LAGFVRPGERRGAAVVPADRKEVDRIAAVGRHAHNVAAPDKPIVQLDMLRIRARLGKAGRSKTSPAAPKIWNGVD
tara:strand:- start:1548 stop:1775 length:228 start_codon:yes stop_codon:yes gene_type:complete